MRYFVRGDRNHSHASHSNNRKRHRIITRQNGELRPRRAAYFCNLRQVATGLFHARDVRDFCEAPNCDRFDIRRRASGHVVENDRLVCRFRNRFEMLILTFLGGLVVVGRGGKDSVHASARREFLCLFNGVTCGI